MTINEFFQKTYSIRYISLELAFQETRPRIYCKDGFSMSVQAGHGIYSSPRANMISGYSAAEIGFPSEAEPLITEYAQFDTYTSDYTKTVYPYVPCEIIDEIIEKHGGIDEDKTFERKEK